jgi:predicted dehydrogenase
VVSLDPSPAAVEAALREGPYGRCVYACDNDVVDHQVVSLEYADGATASFTMTAFSVLSHRKTRIFGTHGCIEGDGETFTVTDFRDRSARTVDPYSGSDPSAAGGHGGGDDGLMTAFLHAVATGDRSGLTSTGAESLASHRVVWAAERARTTGTVVTL